MLLDFNVLLTLGLDAAQPRILFTWILGISLLPVIVDVDCG